MIFNIDPIVSEELSDRTIHIRLAGVDAPEVGFLVLQLQSPILSLCIRQVILVALPNNGPQKVSLG